MGHKESRSFFVRKFSIFEKFIDFTFSDYKAFFALPWKQRFYAASSFALFSLAILVLVHLTFYPSFKDTAQARFYLILYYLLFESGMVLQVSMPILFTGLRNYLGYTTVISYIFFITGGIFLAQASEKGFVVVENLHIFIAWVIGLLSIVYGFKLFIKVFKKFYTSKTAIDTEIELAKNIQKKLIPDGTYENQFVSVYGRTLLANEVGGDFFDYRLTDEGNMVVVLGDVSGHNIAAGLMMAMVKSAFLTEMKYFQGCAQLVDSMNKTVMSFGERKLFVSFQFLDFNFDKNVLTAVNAGHLPFIHIQKTRGLETIQLKKAPALGLSNHSEYTEEIFRFGSGDRFLFVTDGITEAGIQGKKEFGFEGLYKVLNRSRNDNPEDIANNIFKKIDETLERREFQDDMTLFLMDIK